MKKGIFAGLFVLIVGTTLVVQIHAAPRKIAVSEEANNNHVVQKKPAVTATPSSKPVNKPKVNTATEAKPKPQPAPVPAKPQPPAPHPVTVSVQNMGKPITANTLQFTINSARVSTGDGAYVPQQGEQYILIGVSIVNNGNSSVSIAPVMVFNLMDGSNNSYSPIVLDQKEQQIQGDLGPQRSVSGQLRFEVPQGVKAFALQIDPSLVGGNMITLPVSIN